MKIDLVTLLKEISENNAKSFQTLFDLYFDGLFEFANVLLKNRELAQEVVSDVFIKVWKNRKIINKVNNIKSYLFIATKNQALLYLNKKITQTANLEIDNIANLEIVADNFTPECAILLDELHNNLNRVLDALPHRQKMAFQLIREEKLSYKEVATIMNISISAVEKLTFKATRNIVSHLANYLEANKKMKSSTKLSKLTPYILFIIFLPEGVWDFFNF